MEENNMNKWIIRILGLLLLANMAVAGLQVKYIELEHKAYISQAYEFNSPEIKQILIDYLTSKGTNTTGWSSNQVSIAVHPSSENEFYIVINHYVPGK